MKKLLAITLTVCMMICALSISAFAASDPYDDIDAAVAAIGLNSLADKVDQESIYGAPGINDSESFPSLFDDDVTTKYGTREYPAYAAWKMDKAYSIGGIIFSTANDNAGNPGRNPETWVLRGSNDDNTWVDIATGTYEDLEDENYTYYIVKFDAPTAAYEYFMFEVPAAEGGDFFQMAELVLCEADEAPAPAVEEPAVEDVPVEKGETVEETVEEPTEETEAPVVDTPVETTAPATSDYAVIISAVLAAIALAAIVILKKKAVR